MPATTGLPVAELLAGCLGRMPLDVSLGIIAETAHLLERAHAVGHVHGCLSLAALWVSKSGELWLEWHPQETPKHRSLPPELRAGQPPSHASDVYALGAVAYELLTGLSISRAWAKAPLIHLQSVASPKQFSPRVSPEVDAIVSQALSRHPGDRPERIAELATAAECALGGRAWQDTLAGLLSDDFYAPALRDLPVTCERAVTPVVIRPPQPPPPPRLVPPLDEPSPGDEPEVRSSMPMVKIMIATVILAVTAILGALAVARSGSGEGGRAALASRALANAPHAAAPQLLPVEAPAPQPPEAPVARAVKAKKQKAERPHSAKRGVKRKAR